MPKATKPRGGPQGLSGALRKPYGPLPLYGWLLIAAIGGYLAYRHFHGSSSSSSLPVNASTDSSGTPGPDLTGGGGGGGSADAPNPLVLPTTPPPDPTTVQVQTTSASTTPAGDTGGNTSTAPTTYQGVPDPSTAPYAPVLGVTTHPGGNVPIQNIPYGSNIHQPGQQLG